MKILSIGAHPDDADTSAGGLLHKLYKKGWEVRLLSVTNGCSGHYDTSLAGEPLATIRRKEAANSGKNFGAQYDLMDNTDGRLVATLEAREELIRYIRRFDPDVIVTNRPNDYHADHRNTALLVQDASYLLGVPCICKDVPAMTHTPVILFWHDSFQKPYPFQADIAVPIDDELDTILAAACCHECQYFDWMYWPDHMERKDWPREQQIARLKERFEKGAARTRENYNDVIVKEFGEEKAKEIKYAEVYEICEYGDEPSPELIETFIR